jgi:hypothetical protein
MELIIFFKNDREVELLLSRGSIVVDQLIIGLDIHFDTVLVTSIDKVFKRNRIGKSSLNMVKVSPDSDLSSVAYRTAQAVVAAIKSQ